MTCSSQPFNHQFYQPHYIPRTCQQQQPVMYHQYRQQLMPASAPTNFPTLGLGSRQGWPGWCRPGSDQASYLFYGSFSCGSWCLGGGFGTLLYNARMMGFNKNVYALFEASLHGFNATGGIGRGQPPICKHNADGLEKDSYALKQACTD